jgi:O-antigen ligase
MTSQIMLNRLAYLLLLISLALAPLPFGSNREWAWPVLLLLIVISASCLIIGCLRGETYPNAVFDRARWSVYLLAFICLWQLLQIMPMPMAMLEIISPKAAQWHMLAGSTVMAPISLDVYASWVGFLKSLGYLILYSLCLILLNSHRRIKVLLYVMVVSGVFQALYASVLILSGYEVGIISTRLIGDSATGSFINRNHLAGFLEICLALGIGLLMGLLATSKNHSWRQHVRQLSRTLLGEKARLRIFLILMVIALVLSHSRMGNTAFFGSMLVTGAIALLLIWIRSRGRKNRLRMRYRSIIIFIASLILIDILIVGAWFGVDKVVERIENTSMQSEMRDEVNEYSIDMLADYWLSGVGAGAYYSVLPNYMGEDVIPFYDHAHNDYLQFANELGVPVTLLLLIFTLAAYYSALRAMWVRQSRFYFGIGFACVMAMTSLGIHSFVDFNLQIPSNAMYFIVIIALAHVALHAAFQPRRKSRALG